MGFHEDQALALAFQQRFRDHIERSNIDVRSIFETHDKDGNKAVTVGEFRMLCSTVGIPISDRELSALCGRFGNSRNELVYNDFLNETLGIHMRKTGDNMVADDDDHSSIEGLDPANLLSHEEEEEVIIALARIGTELKKRSIDFLAYKEVHDKQRNGMISLDKFKRFFEVNKVWYSDREYQLFLKRFADKKFNINYAEFFLIM